MHACMHVCMYACMHVCMYACMHVCMYACMHVCMYACMYVRMYVCMHACMYVCMSACMHVCMYACMYVCMYVCTYACMYACMYVCMHACTYACTYMYVCMHACMHACMYVCISQITLQTNRSNRDVVSIQNCIKKQEKKHHDIAAFLDISGVIPPPTLWSLAFRHCTLWYAQDIPRISGTPPSASPVCWSPADLIWSRNHNWNSGCLKHLETMEDRGSPQLRRHSSILGLPTSFDKGLLGTLQVAMITAAQAHNGLLRWLSQSEKCQPYGP